MHWELCRGEGIWEKAHKQASKAKASTWNTALNFWVLFPFLWAIQCVFNVFITHSNLYIFTWIKMYLVWQLFLVLYFKKKVFLNFLCSWAEMLFLNALSFLVVSRYESDKKQDKIGACFAQNTKFIIFFHRFCIIFHCCCACLFEKLDSSVKLCYIYTAR